MKRNFKYVKTNETRINHKGQKVWRYKKAGANLTTWKLGRSRADIAKIKYDRVIAKFESMGVLNYLRPGLTRLPLRVRV